MKTSIVTSGDGSHTLRLDGQDEHYHSVFGAVSESKHVFIDSGLHAVLREGTASLSILEVGFGTGLNALLTILDPLVEEVDIYYTGIEAYPLAKTTWQKLNYPEVIADERAAGIYSKLHEAAWDKPAEIRSGFTLHKIRCRLEDYSHDAGKAALIYFDAFAPEVQPELWTPEIFGKITGFTKAGGMLLTYSCKGSVKRALRSAGFMIEKLPGPEGKREILRAIRLKK